LAGGLEKWMDWCTSESRAGKSPDGVILGLRIYADCLQIRVGEDLARAPYKGQTFMPRLEKALELIESRCLPLGQALNGTGTRWVFIGARADISRLQVLYDILKCEDKFQKTKQSEVWAAYRAAKTALARNTDQIDRVNTSVGRGHAEVFKELERAAREFRQVVPLIAQRSESDRCRVMGFYLEMFNLVKLEQASH